MEINKNYANELTVGTQFFENIPGGDFAGEIYVMNADGTGQTNISNNSANDFGPSWSPDGTKIIFASDRDAITNRDLYVMNADGSNPTRLTNNPEDETWPSWSPDGTKIAFQSQSEGENEVIYVMNADGSEQTRLTDDQGGQPSWSPDGTKIAFTRNGQIYVMNADGSEQTNISGGRFGIDPDWGPAVDTD